MVSVPHERFWGPQQTTESWNEIERAQHRLHVKGVFRFSRELDVAKWSLNRACTRFTNLDPTYWTLQITRQKDFLLCNSAQEFLKKIEVSEHPIFSALKSIVLERCRQNRQNEPSILMRTLPITRQIVTKHFTEKVTERQLCRTILEKNRSFRTANYQVAQIDSSRDIQTKSSKWTLHIDTNFTNQKSDCHKTLHRKSYSGATFGFKHKVQCITFKRATFTQNERYHSNLELYKNI